MTPAALILTGTLAMIPRVQAHAVRSRPRLRVDARRHRAGVAAGEYALATARITRMEGRER